MSSEDSSQEKTEEPTAKRLDKAKEDGQIPRSKELTTSFVLLAGTIGLMIFGGGLVKRLAEIFRYNFSFERDHVFDTTKMIAQLAHSFYEVLWVLVPYFSVLGIAAIIGPIALGGWMFSAKSLAPKFNRINAFSGLKRMFSTKSLVELAKAIGKVTIVIFVAFILLSILKGTILSLSEEGVMPAIYHSVQLSLFVSVILSASTLIIAAVDIPFQIFDHKNKLKMSKQDIKDEMKDSEGKPEVKGKIRQLQMQMAQNRMMSSVPEADVIITNPTHFSVALKYDPDSMETPTLLAKGIEHNAMRIREVAKLNDIEIVESPPLARAIYHTTEVEQDIPEGLFLAVAQVLAYVFQLREFRKGRGGRPDYPRNVPVPPDMKY